MNKDERIRELEIGEILEGMRLILTSMQMDAMRIDHNIGAVIGNIDKALDKILEGGRKV